LFEELTENIVETESLPNGWQIGSFEKDVKVKGRIGWRGYKTSDLREFGPAVIGGTNLKSSYYISNEINHISKEKYDESPDIKLKAGDVLLVTRGNGLADVGFFDGNIGEATINPSVIILSNFKGDPRFLFYYLISHEGRKNVLSLSSGSSIPAIYQADIRKLKYPKPPMGEQKNIADFLVDFDKLIGLNIESNLALEQIGKRLFKRWFVDFEFPNQEGKPYKSSGGEMINSECGMIPKGWRISPLRNALSYYVGGGWGEEKAFENAKPAYVIRGTDIPAMKSGDLSSIPLRFHKPTNYKLRELKRNDIILEISGGSKGQPVGRSILINQISLNNLNAICASFCKLMRVKESFSPYYIYILINRLYQSEEIMKYQLQSTGISNFNFEFFLDDLKIFDVPKDIKNNFDKSLSLLYDKIALNGLQNNLLAKTRDYLLPKLMSGKIRAPLDNKMERQ
jgi:type I restriction enzyme, S subunit